MTKDIKIRGSIYIDQFFPREMSIKEAKRKARDELQRINITLRKEKIAPNSYVGGVAWMDAEMTFAEEAKELEAL